MSGLLSGKICLVTGAGSGIGAEAAKLLARKGARVFLNGHNHKPDAIVDEIREQGGQAETVIADVADEAAVAAMIDHIVDSAGRLDGAFNNAGIEANGDLVDVAEADWDKVHSVNLKGVFLCMKHEARVMVAAGQGAIVNNASIAGVIGSPGVTAYSATKGGSLAMMRAAAVELAPKGIRVNAVSPGFVDGPMVDRLPEDFVSAARDKHPMGRFARQDEIAQAVAWLLSDRASFTTGHNLLVDGGYTIT